jgi:hypothetical protein
LSSTPSAGFVEMGSSFNLTLSSTFIKNDAGSATATIYKQGGTALGGNIDNVTNITSAKNYSVEVQFATGAVKNNNLSVPDNVGLINAGSVSASLIITPKLKKYWGTSTSTSPTDAEIIAASSDWANASPMSSFSIPISGQAKYIFYAFPSTLTDITNISVGGFDSFNAFTKISRTVINSSGYSNTYNIYISKNVSTETITNIIIN